MFTLLNTYGVSRLKSNLIENKKTVLFNEASLISSEYMTSYYEGNMALQNISAQLKTIDTFLDARVWIVNDKGVIILDTRSVISPLSNINVLDFNSGILDSTFSINPPWEELIKEPVLTVVLPVSIDFSVRGYIIIHAALSTVTNDSTKFMDIINICFLTFLVLMFFVFAYIYFITVVPLQKIRNAAMEYTTGHFDYPLKVKSSDEYRDLANSIVYMAGEINNLDDYQKKFVANISHDFRSPLTSIKGFAEAILDGTIPPELQNKYLKVISFETDRLNKLTSSLLTLNSFENNGNLLDISSFDINYIIKKTAESFEGICIQKQITLNLIFSEKKLYVNADMGKIQQVLYNLIDNAIKFSHNDSIIKVSTEDINEKVFVSVKDFGCGIPKDSMKKIWERFYKIDTSRGKDKKGTGLGLSIVKEIISAHNENINVISTEEVGTEFVFSLPQTTL